MAGLSPAGHTPINSSGALTNSSPGARRVRSGNGAPSQKDESADGLLRGVPALAAGGSAGFDLDAYLGDELWGAAGPNVSPQPPKPNFGGDSTRSAGGGTAATAGGGLGAKAGGLAAASGASALRARLNAHKGWTKTVTCATDIYASWDGDDALVG
jgi:hypothetical protein